MRRRSWWILIAIVIVSVAVIALLNRSLNNNIITYGARAPLQQMEPPKSGEKILIFAPHEDDETLGCGGYIQQADAAGADVHIVMMTNGEYPEADVVLFEESLKINPKKFVRLGYIRQKETLTAVRHLGLSDKNVTFLGFPNQYLSRMWSPDHWLRDNAVRSKRTQATDSPYGNSMTLHAVYCGHSILQDVKTVLAKYQPDTVITLHPNDVHVDHWPTGTIVQFALEEIRSSGNEWSQKCNVYTYLIHRDWWPEPRSYRPWMGLAPPAALNSVHQTEWFELPLTKEQTLTKQKATGMYRTQFGNYDQLLRSFSRTNELYGVEQAGKWSRNKYAKPKTVIVDPTEDMVRCRNNLDGDIQAVMLSRNAEMMAITIATRGNASADTNYHVSIHAGGPSSESRMVAQYSWISNEVSASIVRNGQLLTPDPNAISSMVYENFATMKTYWPLDDSTHTFFIIRAWTTKKNSDYCIDQTASTLYRVTD